MPYRGKLETALDNILNAFPDNETIEDLKAGVGLGYRMYSVTVFDCEVVEARKQLAELRKVKQ